jgi:hypothetical protein
LSGSSAGRLDAPAARPDLDMAEVSGGVAEED